MGKAACETGGIITVEEHNIIGGLGSAVCEVAAEIGKVKVKRLGIKDHFCQVGSSAYLMEKEGLRAENIIKTALTFTKKEVTL